MSETLSRARVRSSSVPVPIKQDVLHSSDWQYVINPEGEGLEFVRVDPPGKCLCRTCVMNYPAKMDLTDRLVQWKMDCKGNFLTTNATISNTFLLVVSILDASTAVSSGPSKSASKVKKTEDFFLIVDGTTRIDVLNHIVASFHQSCVCHGMFHGAEKYVFDILMHF